MYLPFETKRQRADHIPELTLESHSRCPDKIGDESITVQELGAETHSGWKVVISLQQSPFQKPWDHAILEHDSHTFLIVFLVKWGWEQAVSTGVFLNCFFMSLLLKMSPFFCIDWLASRHSSHFFRFVTDWPWPTPWNPLACLPSMEPYALGPGFVCGCWASRLGLLCFYSKHLPAELSP